MLKIFLAKIFVIFYVFIISKVCNINDGIYSMEIFIISSEFVLRIRKLWCGKNVKINASIPSVEKINNNHVSFVRPRHAGW